MNRTRVWAFAMFLLACASSAVGQEQANEIRCAGAGTTCATSFIPKFASNGGSATVNDSIMFQANSTTIGINGNEYLTGYLQALGGVLGSVTAPGTTFGVTGSSTGSTGVGVAGAVPSFGSLASSILGTAQVGTLGDSNGYGVVATSDNSNALLAENGYSSGNFSDTAVLINLASGFPLYAASPSGSMYLDNGGNLHVSGAVDGAIKNFRIDHPLSPANKYLVHASVESSEMMNIYTGNVTTDAQGMATVQLPEWFEALNTDFRYQLTVIAQFAQAIVAHEIHDHQFAIRTSAPNVKVSWQVTGVRQDAYAKAHPLLVEQEKEDNLRGFYIHPELYGKSPEKGMQWAHHPDLMNKTK